MTSPALKPLHTPSTVAAIPAAPSAEALAHFRARLSHETDCSDVHAALASGAPDFVLAEARGPNAYAAGRIAGAINLPHREITAERMAEWPADTLFVVYCAGPHCNGADRAALKLAELGRPVKVMIGGLAGWLDEGFTLEQA